MNVARTGDAQQKTPHWGSHVENPVVSDIIKSAYGKVAVHLLLLFRPSIPHVGFLVETGENSSSEAGRLITQNMNNVLQPAGCRRMERCADWTKAYVRPRPNYGQ